MQAQKVLGTTKITGLIGNPVSHSLSPLIHNHGFAQLNLDYTYIPLGIKPEALSGLISTLRSLEFAGANVTIPYKSSILVHCDKVSELSQLTGTVNTLYYKENCLYGTTTDGIGFINALAHHNQTLKAKNITIIGNGGTARTLAIILAHQENPSSITLLGRNLQKLTTLAQEVTNKTDFVVHTVTIGSPQEKETLNTTDILVNCTPVGMHPHEDASPIDPTLVPKSTYVFDAIYNPSETKLLRETRARGCAGQNGLMMLLLQGLASFEYWTNTPISPDLFDLEQLQQTLTNK